jgi:putative ABC transport system permease protein
VGRRIRPAEAGGWGLGGENGQWYTIVGVVPDFPPHPASPLRPEPKVYQPFTPGAGARVSVAVRVRDGNPDRYAARMREIAASVDPLLMIDDLASVSEIMNRGSASAKMITAGFVALGGSVLLLAVAGLYALMSFTIVRRRREIGIRAALGGDARGILGSVLRRAMIQMGIGIVVGVMLVGSFDKLLGGGLLSGRAYLVLPGVAALMVVVGLLAAWGPARIGLGIQPTEALRSE